MYELNEHGQVEFSHNPFSMPQGGLEALQTQNPLDILAWQYDIVCNGIELSSGAIRNHQPEIMYKAFEIAGYSKKWWNSSSAACCVPSTTAPHRTAASHRASLSTSNSNGAPADQQP